MEIGMYRREGSVQAQYCWCSSHLQYLQGRYMYLEYGKSNTVSARERGQYSQQPYFPAEILVACMYDFLEAYSEASLVHTLGEPGNEAAL